MIMRVIEEIKENKLKIYLINQENYKFERLENCVYLGVVIGEEGMEIHKLDAKVAKSNKKEA